MEHFFVRYGREFVIIEFDCTLQTDGFEVGDSAAGPQVKEVVVGVLRDGLTLVPVVVHVETLASRISLTPFMTFIRIFIQI